MSNFENLSKKEFLAFLKSQSDLYYSSSQQSSISDEDFDSLVKFYESKFNEEFNYLGQKGETRLPIYMGSLDKVKDDNSLINFQKKVNKDFKVPRGGETTDGTKVPHGTFVISDKVDGLSLLIEFKDGKATRAFTRGDGTFGNDVSNLLKYIKTVTQIDCKDIVYIRGEIVIPIQVFQDKYETSFKNPRNLVAGLVNSKEKNISMLKDIQFIAYYVYSDSIKFKSSNDMFEFLKNKKFSIPYYKTLDHLTQKSLTELFTQRKEILDYEKDGLVITTRDVHEEPSGENPNYTIAFKCIGETMDATVNSVEWSVTKHRILKPVINLHPIQLSGVTITNTTGFNARFIKDNKIGPGTVLKMVRSGDVIPYIVKIVKPTIASLPERECYWNETEVELVIPEDDVESGEVWIKRMICMFEQLKIKGVKEGVLKNLYDHGVTTERELFELTKEQLLEMDGVKEKSAQNILDAIMECKSKMDLKTLMISSCLFPGFGASKIEKLLMIENIKDILIGNTVRYNEDVLVERLNKLGFNKMAQVFVDGIKKFQAYYKNVEDIFLNVFTREDDDELMIIEPEAGTFCMSGFRDRELSERLERKGYKEDQDVKKTTTYLIVKEIGEMTGKMKKAEKYGVKIVTVEEISKIILK